MSDTSGEVKFCEKCGKFLKSYWGLELDVVLLCVCETKKLPKENFGIPMNTQPILTKEQEERFAKANMRHIVADGDFWVSADDAVSLLAQEIQRAEKEAYERGYHIGHSEGEKPQAVEYLQPIAEATLAERKRIVGVIEGVRPVKPYPNASNGYQKDFDDEDKAMDKLLSALLQQIND